MSRSKGKSGQRHKGRETDAARKVAAVMRLLPAGADRRRLVDEIVSRDAVRAQARARAARWRERQRLGLIETREQRAARKVEREQDQGESSKGLTQAERARILRLARVQ